VKGVSHNYDHPLTRSQAVKSLLQCGLVAIVLGIHAQASCVTELSKIVKTTHGRVTSPNGKQVSGAEITVSSSSDEDIFKTKSKHDGTFKLDVTPGKYRVEVSAEGYIGFVYVVDLRSREGDDSFNVALQDISACHDIRVVSGTDPNSEDKCSSEVLLPNLVLQSRTVITGDVRDETGAPFQNSQVVLSKLSDIPLQPAYLDAKTDVNGAFKFDEAEPGNYRLLASPNRAFAQPEKLDCYERRDCKLEIVLKANSTDRQYAGCSVR
jgi:Carboxypeptidase regulatory-like domain